MKIKYLVNSIGHNYFGGIVENNNEYQNAANVLSSVKTIISEPETYITELQKEINRLQSLVINMRLKTILQKGKGF